MTRYQTTLVRERTAEINRLHNTLERDTIKLGDVATDAVGLSGRAIMGRSLLANATSSYCPIWRGVNCVGN